MDFGEVSLQSQLDHQQHILPQYILHKKRKELEETYNLINPYSQKKLDFGGSAIRDNPLIYSDDGPYLSHNKSLDALHSRRLKLAAQGIFK